MQWLAQISIVTPQQFTLRHDGFVVPYAETIDGMPTLQFGAALPLFVAGQLETQVLALAGYSFREGLFSLTGPDGFRREQIRIHRLPLSAGVRVLYHISWLSFVKPSLTVGAGAQWMYQTSYLPGLQKSFWVPFYFVSPSLTFFESGVESVDWFGGFTFGLTYQNDLDPRQRLRAWSFDLSVNLFL